MSSSNTSQGITTVAPPPRELPNLPTDEQKNTPPSPRDDGDATNAKEGDDPATTTTTLHNDITKLDPMNNAKIAHTHHSSDREGVKIRWPTPS
jgi:hypothetical protein